MKHLHMANHGLPTPFLPAHVKVLKVLWLVLVNQWGINGTGLTIVKHA